MRTFSLLIVTLLVSAVAAPVLAQDAFPGGPATGPAAGASPVVSLAHDVELLQVIRGLQLTNAQIQNILPVLEPIQKKLQAFRATEDALWQRSGENIGKVYEAWVALKAPDAAVKADADKAASDYDAANADLNAAAEQAAEQIRGFLNADQAVLIESVQAERRRRQAEAALGGSDSAAEYVARRIEALRSLMPDEYTATRVAEAQDIAAVLVGPRARNFDAAARRVLRVLDDATNWSADTFQTNRAQLPSMVAKALDLPNVVRPLLTHEESLTVLRDPRLFALLTQIGGGVPAPDPAPQQPGPHDLEVAITLAHNLTTVNDLGLTTAQLSQIAPTIATLTNLAQGSESTAVGRRTPVEAQLKDARKELLAGQTVDEVTAATLQMLLGADRKAQVEQFRSATAALDLVRRVFTERQNARVDWRPPVGLSAARDIADQAARAKKLAGDMCATIGFLTGIRYMAADIYMTIGRVKTTEFVQRYIDADVQSREFQRYLGAVNDLAYKAKMVPEQDWDRAQTDFAQQILRTLGVTNETAAAPAGNRPYDWQAMYDLFSYPKTGAMVNYILQVRAK